MTTQINYKNNELHLKLKEQLIKKNINEFELDIIPILLLFDIDNVFIDFSEVISIDKSGIDSIIKISDLVRKNNGKVTLYNTNEKINKYLKDNNVYDYCYSEFKILIRKKMPRL